MTNSTISWNFANLWNQLSSEEIDILFEKISTAAYGLDWDGEEILEDLEQARHTLVQRIIDINSNRSLQEIVDIKNQPDFWIIEVPAHCGEALAQLCQDWFMDWFDTMNSFVEDPTSSFAAIELGRALIMVGGALSLMKEIH
jgi:hypothetical protein